MRAQPSRLVLAVTLLLAAPWPLTARAEPTSAHSGAAQPLLEDAAAGDSAREVEARARYARAVELYERRQYRLALAEFESVHRLTGDPQLLFNVGQLHYQLEHFARAASSLRQYLEEGGALIPAPRREQVQRQLSELRSHTAVLRVTTQPTGATVELDGAELAHPDGPVLVDAGVHHIAVHRTQHESALQTVTLVPEEVRSISFRLVPRPAPSSPWATVSWVSTGVFGAIAVGGLLATLQASRNYERARHRQLEGEPLEIRRELDAKRARVRSYAALTDGAAALAAVSGMAGVYFSFVRSEADPAAGVQGLQVGLDLNF